MKESTSEVKPLFLTKKNSEPATGEQLKFWKAHYPHLVRRIGRKDVIVAAELERAVQATGKPVAAAQNDVDAGADPAEAVRSILRRAGGQ